MAKLFDYINSINDKKYIFVEGEDKEYNQFMVNKFFMHFPDTLFIVNEMNSRTLTNKQHYDFLYNVIDKKKRFTKWYKETTDSNVQLVVEFYDVSETKAIEYLNLMSEDDIESIKLALDKGGVK